MNESVLGNELALENLENTNDSENNEELYEDLQNFVFNTDKNIDVN